MITRDNYEIYFLDYSEGNLSTEDIELLYEFVESNPDLKEDLEVLNDEFKLIPDTTVQFDSSTLKQTDLVNDAVNHVNFEDFAIALHENDLDLAKKVELNTFSEKNSLNDELALYETLKLAPDPSVVFNDKKGLKKGGFLIPLWVRYSAAAALFLLFGYFLTLGIRQNYDHDELVANKEIPANQLTSPDDNEIIEDKTEYPEEGKNDQKEFVAIETSSKPSKKEETVPVADESNSLNKKKDTDVKRIEQKPEKKSTELIARSESRGLQPSGELFEKKTIAAPSTPVIEQTQIAAVQRGTKNSYTLKQFVALKFKRKVLKSESNGSTIKPTDFNHTLNKVTKGTVALAEVDNQFASLSVKNRFLNYTKKIKNQL